MKKLILLCSIIFMYCVSIKAQTISTDAKVNSDANSGTNMQAKADNVNAVKPVNFNVTVQNNTGTSATFQIQIMPTFSGGTYASFNFSSSQTVSLVAGTYNIYMRGPGQSYKFAYQICATFGNVTGTNATFSNVNVCSDGIISVGN